MALAVVLMGATGFGLLADGAYRVSPGVRDTLPQTLRGQDLLTLLTVQARRSQLEDPTDQPPRLRPPLRRRPHRVDGLEGLAAELAAVRTDANPHLRVVGVVLFDIGAGDHRLRAEAARSARQAPRRHRAGTGGHRVPQPPRRPRQPPPRPHRRGVRARRTDQPRWIDDPTAPTYSTAAAGLAGDYQQLTDEVLRAISAAYDEARS